MHIDSTLRITSTGTYAKQFTFFIKAKRTNTNCFGRAFTNTSDKKPFGWWQGNRRCAGIEGDIYGVSNNLLTVNNDVNTYMFVSNNDMKELDMDFYEGKT